MLRLGGHHVFSSPAFTTGESCRVTCGAAGTTLLAGLFSVHRARCRLSHEMARLCAPSNVPSRHSPRSLSTRHCLLPGEPQMGSTTSSSTSSFTLDSAFTMCACRHAAVALQPSRCPHALHARPAAQSHDKILLEIGAFNRRCTGADALKQAGSGAPLDSGAQEHFVATDGMLMRYAELRGQPSMLTPEPTFTVVEAPSREQNTYICNGARSFHHHLSPPVSWRECPSHACMACPQRRTGEH